ncbi:MAG: hypothetical protein F3745_00935 [Nitrospinae bacterium]|nr:hypothetical protein [Nitrospinota bacterium]
MKPKILILAGFILLIIPHITYSADFTIQPPPQSMDKFYSERGKTSEWIEQMRQISKAFGATHISLVQKKWGEALKHAQDFSKAYQKASEMVPEWKELFDLESLELYAEAIQSQDAERINKFSKKLEKTCGQCHRKHKLLYGHVTTGHQQKPSKSSTLLTNRRWTMTGLCTAYQLHSKTLRYSSNRKNITSPGKQLTNFQKDSEG